VILLDPARFYRRDIEVAQYGRFNRGFQYSQAIHLGVTEPVAGLLGRGTGSNTASTVFKTSLPTVSMFSQWSMTSLGAMGVIWLYTEYGLVGVIFFLYFLWLMFQRAKVLIASGDREERIYGRTLEAIVVAFAVWNFYGPAWQLDSISIGFWPLAALLVRLSYQVEARQKLAAASEAASPAVTQAEALLPAV
jgi:glucose uptake protein GlcU